MYKLRIRIKLWFLIFETNLDLEVVWFWSRSSSAKNQEQSNSEFVSGTGEHLLDYILLVSLFIVGKLIIEFSDEFYSY